MELNLTESQLINFWNKVNKKKSNIFYKGTRCWEWIGGCASGYGQFRTSPIKKEGAHRLSYYINYGSFDKKLFICHHCDNPKCVNPEHLFLGNSSKNMVDMFSKGRGNRATGDRNGTHIHPEKVIKEEKSHFSKLSRDKVLDILYLYYQKGLTQKNISDKYNVTRGNIGHIVRGKIWKDTYDIFMNKKGRILDETF